MRNDLLNSLAPSFTSLEVKELFPNTGARTRDSLIAYHTKRGHLLRVRRGLYATVPTGLKQDDFSPDPYILASKMAPDAILAYHSALELHGKAHSTFERIFFLSKAHLRPLEFRSLKFVRVAPQKALVASGSENCAVMSIDRSGVSVRVTSLERTMVDVLDRPELGGGWEEIWQSLEGVEFFDLDEVVKYALLLDNATTVAKVGFYLEQHRESLMVEDGHLAQLKGERPMQPHYMERGNRASGRFVKEWNLVVPAQVIDRSWEEER